MPSNRRDLPRSVIDAIRDDLFSAKGSIDRPAPTQTERLNTIDHITDADKKLRYLSNRFKFTQISFGPYEQAFETTINGHLRHVASGDRIFDNLKSEGHRDSKKTFESKVDGILISDDPDFALYDIEKVHNPISNKSEWNVSRKKDFFKISTYTFRKDFVKTLTKYFSFGYSIDLPDIMWNCRKPILHNEAHIALRELSHYIESATENRTSTINFSRKVDVNAFEHVSEETIAKLEYTRDLMKEELTRREKGNFVYGGSIVGGSAEDWSEYVKDDLDTSVFIPENGGNGLVGDIGWVDKQRSFEYALIDNPDMRKWKLKKQSAESEYNIRATAPDSVERHLVEPILYFLNGKRSAVPAHVIAYDLQKPTSLVIHALDALSGNSTISGACIYDLKFKKDGKKMSCIEVEHPIVVVAK